jgi:hypothetical protein
MPAIWVINPVCLSQGWGLIWTVIALGLGETSGVIIKGVVSPRVNTDLLVSSPVNMAVTHNPLPYVFSRNYYHCYYIKIRSHQTVCILGQVSCFDLLPTQQLVLLSFLLTSYATILSGPVEFNKKIIYYTQTSSPLLKFKARLEMCIYFRTTAVKSYIIIIIIIHYEL